MWAPVLDAPSLLLSAFSRREPQNSTHKNVLRLRCVGVESPSRALLASAPGFYMDGQFGSSALGPGKSYEAHVLNPERAETTNSDAEDGRLEAYSYHPIQENRTVGRVRITL